MTATMLPSFATIALGLLEPHPDNRKHFDKAKLEELTKSIRASGVFTPLLVRELPEERYQIIAGARRWKAAREAGLKELPCIVRELSDDEALELLLTENLQREDPHPLEEAATFQVWLDRTGHDVNGLAAKIGKSTGYIYQRLQLQKLSEAGKKMLWAEELPLTLALLLSREPEETQKKHLGDMKRNMQWRGLPTTADLAHDLQRDHKDLAKAPFSTNAADLVTEAGSCVACPKRTGFTPELFPEIAKKADHCTDGTCFAKKLQAHLKLEETRLRKEHPDLVLVSQGYNHQPPKVGQPITQPHWRTVKKTEKGAKLALHVDGEHIGTTGWVEVGKAKAHSSSRAPARPSAPKVDAAKNRLKLRREIGRRGAVLKAVLDAVGKGIDRHLLLPILALELDMGDFDRDHFAAVTGLKVRPGFRPTASTLDKLTERQLNQIMVLLDVQFEPSSAAGTPAHLLALAKTVKVNAKAVGDRFEVAAKKGLKGVCSKCLCTTSDPCDKGGKKCAWTNKDETLCSHCADAPKKAAKK
jgi:ParB/RepB/Spo0J family partition protein